MGGIIDPANRRASMPNADSLQLYPPMTLQSMPNTPAGHHGSPDYIPSRHVMGPTRSSHHLGPLSGGVEYTSRSMGLYVSGQGSHSTGPTGPSHYLNSSSDIPLSAPPSMPNNPFSNPQQTSQQNLYSSLNPSPRLPQSTQPTAPYYEGQTGASSSAPGSGYATPQWYFCLVVIASKSPGRSTCINVIDFHRYCIRMAVFSLPIGFIKISLDLCSRFGCWIPCCLISCSLVVDVFHSCSNPFLSPRFPSRCIDSLVAPCECFPESLLALFSSVIT